MNLDEQIQLDENSIDKAAVVQTVAENLARHKLQPPEDFPTFAPEPLLHLSKSARVEALVQQVDQLNKQSTQLWLEPTLPLGETAWQRLMVQLKRPFHQLIVYYLNQLAAQQNEINDQVRRILTLLTAELARPESDEDG